MLSRPVPVDYDTNWSPHSRADAYVLDGPQAKKHTRIHAEGLSAEQLRHLAGWCLKAAKWIETPSA